MEGQVPLISFSHWFLECFVHSYAYRLTDIVKNLSAKLELDELQVDMYIEFCIKAQSA